jgi:hypothetical protein
MWAGLPAQTGAAHHCRYRRMIRQPPVCRIAVVALLDECQFRVTRVEQEIVIGELLVVRFLDGPLTSGPMTAVAT